MHKKLATFCSLLAGGLLIAGWSSTRIEAPPNTTTTGVQLSQNNYKVVKAGARGESRGFRLLGIIPFGSPKSGAAKQRLYASVDQPLTGRAIALANQTEDRSTLYLILFSIPKLTVTADVIEFTDKAPGQ